ncbi:hypothetical protein [Dactylococcopsis salina]|uniref:Uncharacterized protein n=1 Tax=Dactylococcopsis salina (strain PCC 8305) TaxID=13035 RepID=K9YX82_DACS8|nr:hypothetical protein [Dactylococcopsis salina]AFZ51122.1 hypothetical protein Dacsa_2532 [Dactylococcopsis salina PCC 8305]
MPRIELKNGEIYEVDHDEIPEFFHKHQSEIVEHQKKIQPRRNRKDLGITKTK